MQSLKRHISACYSCIEASSMPHNALPDGMHSLIACIQHDDQDHKASSMPHGALPDGMDLA
eukprot:scaffold44138_cov19-Tisochrysis_lutea.AAC.4